MGANENGVEPVGSAGSRVSRVVPVGTADEQTARAERAPAENGEGDAARGGDAVAAVAAGAVRQSDVVPRNTGVREQRTPWVPDFAATRMGTGFGFDEDDEATTVDASAELTDEDREALARIRSAMVETRVLGTPLPEAVQPVDGLEAARERRNAFKQTMMLGLPRLESPLPAPVSAPISMTKATPRAVLVPIAEPEPAGDGEPSAAAEPVAAAEPAAAAEPTALLASTPMEAPEPAVLASVVRVVGPPTQPPPRRSRRSGGVISSEASLEPSEPDHEAFVLRNPIAAPERLKAQPSAPPPEPLPRLGVSVSRGSLPGVILPPAPTAAAYELASAARSSAPPLRTTIEPPRSPLRATIEPPMALSRTRPPVSRRTAGEAPPLDELAHTDPFAGFVAPAPSLAQRWLVVVVVALAVVGLCSLAAIALGLLGKTG